jgi:predicted O-methyltransferase YrrM
MNPVQVDFCHGDLIANLVKCHKPKTVLELGFGSGFSSRKILAALDYNETGELTSSYGPPATYTLVDNWLDWREKGAPPPDMTEFQTPRTTIVNSNEHDFVFGAKEKWDFIFSDADHFNAEKWFDYVFDNLLNEKGILIYHDICESAPPNNEFWFPNLTRILTRTRERKLSHYLFNRDSLASERCWRGLLVIFKN